jgi:predicted ester cyclase
VKEFFTMFFAAVPDARFGVQHVVAEGDRVAAHFTIQGTHQGPLFGIPPTGRSFTFTGVDFWRFAGGQAMEHWDVLDNLGLMQQLGVIPTPGQ